MKESVFYVHNKLLAYHKAMQKFKKNIRLQIDLLALFEGTYSEIYEQVGNAVPPLLARAVAAEIASMLKSVDADRRAPVKSRYRVEHPAQIAAE